MRDVKAAFVMFVPSSIMMIAWNGLSVFSVPREIKDRGWPSSSNRLYTDGCESIFEVVLCT